MSQATEFNEDDEFGQVEATEIPVGHVESDPYYPDDNYDESLAEVDPEQMGHE